MEFSEELLLSTLASFVWPFVRISAVLMSMFAFSSQSVPVIIRMVLALVITFVMLPSLPPLPIDIPMFSPASFVLVGYQMLIGIIIGFITQFISQIFVVAGQVIAMQTGLGFASLVDPVSGTNTPVVGQFFTVLCTLVFFCINGHIIFFSLLLESFNTLPMGNFLPAQGLHDFILFAGTMFKVGLAMAMSSICTMLVVNFTLGVMTKAAPQLNIFSLGFAVTMIVGLFVLLFSLNAFTSNFSHNFNEVLSSACSLVNTSCGDVFD